MRTLVYLDGAAVPDPFREWAEKQPGNIGWRNGQKAFSSERGVDRVVTDLSHVAEAYEGMGVEVEPLPDVSSEPKVSATSAAAELAHDEEVDLSEVEGTGSGGRVLKSDVQSALEE
jgi:pyruvate/2-oxoglutarate dehydrogenase complex dihydrolipoamide acyltransferase (E2) component